MEYNYTIEELTSVFAEKRERLDTVKAFRNEIEKRENQLNELKNDKTFTFDKTKKIAELENEIKEGRKHFSAEINNDEYRLWLRKTDNEINKLVPALTYINLKKDVEFNKIRDKAFNSLEQAIKNVQAYQEAYETAVKEHEANVVQLSNGKGMDNNLSINRHLSDEFSGERNRGIFNSLKNTLESKETGIYSAIPHDYEEQ